MILKVDTNKVKNDVLNANYSFHGKDCGVPVVDIYLEQNLDLGN